jgi:cytidylate kinase
MPAHPVPVITIDGPTASGKGTVAHLVADLLGFHYLDSGALYRLTALSTPLTDEHALAKLAEHLPCHFTGGEIFLASENVSDAIRAEVVGNAASKIATLPMVRHALLGLQLGFRRPPGLVADGRDMGSVIFPMATLKIFLLASPEARAQRRYKQLIEKGFPANIDDLYKDLLERDARDANRSISPLKPAQGAHILDTSNMGIDAAVTQVMTWYAAVK